MLTKEFKKANYKARIFEAKGKKELGFAEAAVDAAKLKAKTDNRTIYLAELHRDIVTQQPKSMENTKLDAPDTVIINGGKPGTTDLLNIKLVRNITAK